MGSKLLWTLAVGLLCLLLSAFRFGSIVTLRDILGNGYFCVVQAGMYLIMAVSGKGGNKLLSVGGLLRRGLYLSDQNRMYVNPQRRDL